MSRFFGDDGGVSSGVAGVVVVVAEDVVEVEVGEDSDEAAEEALAPRPLRFDFFESHHAMSMGLHCQGSPSSTRGLMGSMGSDGTRETVVRQER